MHITLITPAPMGSKAGNRATAERWGSLLSLLGHQVRIVTGWDQKPADLVIALHAWRSHDAIQQVRRQSPSIPLITVLTGTDIYHFQHSHPAETLASMAAADLLVGLHDQVWRDIPPRFRDKLVTVLQSADPLPQGATEPEVTDTFDVCVIGHLREEKDSLLAARAARLLPAASRIRVCNAGKAHTSEWREMAEAEVRTNPRFCWLGEVDRDEVRQIFARSQVMVISSRIEGGANVVSEACRAGIPVLASDIPGNRGLLGDDYPGYFPAGDERALATLLGKAEHTPEFLADLRHWVTRLASRFTPEAEQAALAAAIREATLRHGE